LHPEKALMVRADFATERADEHERLIAALIEACRFCDQPENRELICAMLAEPAYVDAPMECLKAGLVGPFNTRTRGAESPFGLNVFHHHNANDPSDDKASWISSHLCQFLNSTGQASLKSVCHDYIFRRDIYLRAKALVRKSGALKHAKKQCLEEALSVTA